MFPLESRTLKIWTTQVPQTQGQNGSWLLFENKNKFNRWTGRIGLTKGRIERKDACMYHLFFFSLVAIDMDSMVAIRLSSHLEMLDILGEHRDLPSPVPVAHGFLWMKGGKKNKNYFVRIRIRRDRLSLVPSHFLPHRQPLHFSVLKFALSRENRLFLLAHVIPSKIHASVCVPWPPLPSLLLFSPATTSHVSLSIFLFKLHLPCPPFPRCLL